MAAASSQRDWPFSRSELTAGLRRYLAASSLRLLDIRSIPLPSTMPGASLSDAGTKLSAMSVDVRIDGEQQNLPLVLKEPPVNRSGRVLTAIGQREYGVYRRLAPHLPLLVPGLVAGDESQGWFILEVLTGLRLAPDWTVGDYEEALLNMVSMHDRFWGLSEDLATFPWLARPLDADYTDTVMAAADAVEVLAMSEMLTQINTIQHLQLFGCLTRSADEIVALLQNETATLIHGDYWPGNIARPIDGRQIVFDWQLAGIGPALLDLVGFVQAVQMQLTPSMPVADMIAYYREKADKLIDPGWHDDHFDRLWDHALMWLFMANWLGKLATMTPNTYSQIHDRFEAVWLEPVSSAVERRLQSRE